MSFMLNLMRGGDGCTSIGSRKFSLWVVVLLSVSFPLLVLLLLLSVSRMPLFLGFSWRCDCGVPAVGIPEHVGQGVAISNDVHWLLQQVQGLAAVRPGAWQIVRKGINPRTRQQQLFDLRRFHGISHYQNGSKSQVDCPGELLIEHHHSYYGEPWAGGRDVFDFLAAAISLKPGHRILEVGCGTLRVGLHFIRFLQPSHFHCLERDSLSLTAALLYELPANGLLHKRPRLVRGDELQRATGLLEGPPYDLVYASAVFLHMPDAAVWNCITSLGPRLSPMHGRLFVSHNIKFCSRLSDESCKERLMKAGLQFVSKRVHSSLLFNHYEIWYEFKPYYI